MNSFKTDRLFFKGQKASKYGDYDLSLAYYNQAIKISPNEPWLYLHKGISFAETGKLDEAINETLFAIGINNTKHAYFLYLGIFYFDSERYDDALKAFMTALELSPGNSLALCYINLVNYLKGIDVLQSLNNIRKNITSTNSDFKGRFLVQCEKALNQNRNIAKNFEECIADKTNSTQQSEFSLYTDKLICNIKYMFNSNKRNAYIKLIEGKSCLINNKYDDAINNYRTTLQLLPGLDEAVNCLIHVFLYRKMYSDLFELLRNINDLKEIKGLFDPNTFNNTFDKFSDEIICRHSNIILIIGQVYFNLGDYNKSNRCFSKLARNFTKEFYIQYYCGLCSIALNNLKEAFDHFRYSMNIINPKVAEKRLAEMIKIAG
jgi:tetratricopeptide (TPR) repeat protein